MQAYNIPDLVNAASKFWPADSIGFPDVAVQANFSERITPFFAAYESATSLAEKETLIQQLLNIAEPQIEMADLLRSDPSARHYQDKFLGLERQVGQISVFFQNQIEELLSNIKQYQLNRMNPAALQDEAALILRYFPNLFWMLGFKGQDRHLVYGEA